jgi:hypothetical protein
MLVDESDEDILNAITSEYKIDLLGQYVGKYVNYIKVMSPCLAGAT